MDNNHWNDNDSHGTWKYHGGKMERVDTGLVKYEAGDRILTDDKAPVELLSMKAIDAIIRDEVDYYKDIYKEKGIKGLLEEL